MAKFTRGNQLRIAMSAPAVAVAYAAIALLVTRIGCTPPFADVDFFGAPVTVFLLLALTLAALMLIVFAGVHAWRTFRVPRRRRSGADFNARRGLSAGAVALALAAFAASIWLGIYLLRAPCA